jgi:histidinol-phosphate/aromatic aminotransferase/cobyric acid decarboxylase-like protein
MEPTRAVHGGAFFDALGEDFAHLERVGEIVNADVLDAWYDPSPRVIAAIQAHLSWLIKTSPPTHGDGLRKVISATRGVPSERIVVGAGSSSLMFSAIPRLIKRGDVAVILDPMYGEYAHLLDHLIGAEVRRFELPLDDFRVDVARSADFARDAALVVMVNPNSPTGVAVSRPEMEVLLNLLPTTTKLWVDETYIDFVPGSQSVEPLCAAHNNLIVSKSMSKYYALSGLRVGYLACSPSLAIQLEEQNPPWAVGMLAQLAGVEALSDPAY